jgi:methionyl-tRNA formyltransferase
MNIILFLNRDLESNLAYNLLKPELAQHNLQVFLSEGVGNTFRKPEQLLLLESFEKTYFFGLISDLIRQHSIETDFEFFNSDFDSAPCEVCHDVNEPAFVDRIRKFRADVFLSIRFGKIFKDEIIQLPKKGVLNLHSAVLPDYRGILGTLHALRDGRKEIGCTLHYISNHTIDTGQILEVSRMDVVPGQSLFRHIVNLYPEGVNMIVKVLRVLEEKDRLSTYRQDLSKGCYYSSPNEQHFQHLIQSGFPVITKEDYLDFLAQRISPDLPRLLKEHFNSILKLNQSPPI